MHTSEEGTQRAQPRPGAELSRVTGKRVSMPLRQDDEELIMRPAEMLLVSSASEFAAWLQAHPADTREVWVVIYKKASGKQAVTFNELLEVALCCGWIDSKERSLDAERYAVRFTPRKPGSSWSTYNRKLVRRLLAEGRVTESGKAVLPPDL